MNFEQARFNMVEQQIRPWDVLDFDVLDALSEVPREYFVAESQQAYAYADKTLPLPNGGSMLEPKIVARLIQGLALKADDKVLEVGTGSGYAAALLSKLSANVMTVDVDAEQQQRAKAVLDKLGFNKIIYEVGDGLAGALGGAPFDAVYIGGAVPVVPEALKNQLNNNGGRMVVVVGEAPVQRALLITRNGDAFAEQVLFDTYIPQLKTPTLSPTAKFNF
ncbi:protein-L-isoaspartate O-methyltransferase family protein [Neisseria zoodegmatis]|uniref:Protein-L-isoaspartate O-methyltransferase n=1 Tax=Neisseria zoodegmatis TaxID=326523 RepID=A0AB38DQC4_9NEIS|nr:protein-L-isoaspartate O-methyltransferase [Neisseria zoodegmatis]MDO5068731.1 protein-L-isoaspartate O-methyltransferase [Neisseria zoodegmatis]OSI10583.1 protein-L-isoaspartate O-methyltransferase [Neisseria zoodegmatis]SNU79543.1 protein-L-isoaspartate O-methyltransferase [Neisseria zoodegmatis]